MKSLFIFFFLFASFATSAQSLNQANNLFSNYEYARAASIFKQVNSSQGLSKDDFKKLTYATYIIGDYASCEPLIDSLMKGSNIEPDFYLIYGDVLKARKRYSEAKIAYSKYPKTDRIKDVQLLVASCDSISTWNDMTFARLENRTSNFSKANISGGNWNGTEMYYRELGKDQEGIETNDTLVDDSELLLLKPFLRSSEGITTITLSDSLKYDNINSIVLVPSTQKVMIGMSNPLATTNRRSVPLIYQGKYDISNNTVNSVSPWEFGGYSDTSSCSHLTINASGNLLVMAKSSYKEEQSDLYYSELTNGTWTKPTKIGEINTTSDEMYPLFSGDSLLTFATEGRIGYGGLDVYASKVQGTRFSTPFHFKAPVNGPQDDFNFTYYSPDSARFTSNRFGGKGDDDEFKLVIREPIEIKPEPIDTFEENFVPPIVYFDFDKFNLKRDVYNLDALVNYLAKHKMKKIMVEGYCDERGTPEYNMALGLKRAETIKLELAAMGIDHVQIVVSSKGSSELAVKCPPWGCPETDHAKNRFALIKLVK